MTWLYIQFVAPLVCLLFGHRDRFTLRAVFGEKGMTTAFCARCKRIHEVRVDPR